VVFKMGDQQLVAKALREVLLCAGAIKTPQVLELSGIGKKDVPEAARIECVVENESVGENLQECGNVQVNVKPHTFHRQKHVAMKRHGPVLNCLSPHPTTSPTVRLATY
jgi:choline dehydrogenase-like flavoprotein